jgi:hypothetical protein
VKAWWLGRCRQVALPLRIAPLSRRRFRPIREAVTASSRDIDREKVTLHRTGELAH